MCSFFPLSNSVSLVFKFLSLIKSEFVKSLTVQSENLTRTPYNHPTIISQTLANLKPICYQPMSIVVLFWNWLIVTGPLMKKCCYSGVDLVVIVVSFKRKLCSNLLLPAADTERERERAEWPRKKMHTEANVWPRVNLWLLTRQGQKIVALLF